jgi:predicted small lipoprotein YifL
MKNFYIFIVFLLFLHSCGNVGKVLRNEKVKSTDEFLVKKKGPLVLPPDFKKIPEPETLIKKEENQKDKIKKILKAPKKDTKIKTNSSSVEQSILNKIRK